MKRLIRKSTSLTLPSKKRRQPRTDDKQAGRVEPDRKWFGNTRVLDQKELDKYRTELDESTKAKGQGYTVVIKGRKLPLSLLRENMTDQTNKIKVLEIESYKNTFGPKSQRKRPKLNTTSMELMRKNAEIMVERYDPVKDKDLHKNDDEGNQNDKDYRLEAGQSKRIWMELYKVMDSSDVILQVLDVRDPMGTRSTHIEKHLKKNCPNKHMILILNKCDLVPTSVTSKWIKILGREYPTLAFQANVQNPFGKGSLIQLLRQFDNFHKGRKTIAVGFIGYPNVGKSSIINTLKKKAVCKVAPIPGETKVWQYITMTKRIYLIDCPGVVHDTKGDSDVDVVLKGVARSEKLNDPDVYIHELLERAGKKNIMNVYGIE